MAGPLLSVTDLETHFSAGSQTVQAVRGVSFCVNAGEALGIVGESGSGKSVTALSIMRLVPTPPGRIVGGHVDLAGEDILTMSPRKLRAIRGKQISMVFQDPFSSLNPTMSLGEQVSEAIRTHTGAGRAEARQQTLDLFQAVRIPSPEIRYRQYPHQVSGGQRQRVMIAMAFSTSPGLMIADEPTTALDVTVQAQIMSLMDDFRKRTGAAVLMITHDLGVVAEMCDRLLVMYAGRIVEQGPVAAVFGGPAHPYTQGLLRSLPPLSGERRERLESIPGQPPDLSALTGGCPFAERCERAQPLCRTVDPETTIVAWDRTVRCHFPIAVTETKEHAY